VGQLLAVGPFTQPDTTTVGSQGQPGCTALPAAVECGYLAVVERQFDPLGLPRSAAEQHTHATAGVTPLQAAAEAGNMPMLELFLSRSTHASGKSQCATGCQTSQLKQICCLQQPQAKQTLCGSCCCRHCTQRGGHVHGSLQWAHDCCTAGRSRCKAGTLQEIS
jgi:hypothetical protein